MKPFLTIAFAISISHFTRAFDYVVIGGGTAGLTVASRLSEDPSVNVAVVEAGFNAEDLPEVFIPGLFGAGEAFTTLDWQYQTVPQANLDNRSLLMHAGKALGGSTVINGMIFPRARKEQYDVWGALNNDSSWTWDGLLPFLKKSEHASPPDEFQKENGVQFEPAVHGFTGGIHLGFANFFFEQANQWVQAVTGLGLKVSPDFDNGDPHAVGTAPTSLDEKNNTRCSAVCAYVTPTEGRTNLHIITNATVSRIIWANDTSKHGEGDLIIASAVEFILLNGTTMQIPVEKEVIVSAGTVGTPKVLELSGVGNATIIEAVGIESKVNLPTVGENLVDHAHSYVNCFTTFNLTGDIAADPTFFQEQMDLWLLNRTGFFSVTLGTISLVAPSDILTKSELDTLVGETRRNLTQTAAEFSNGNAALARGIQAQIEQSLTLYESDIQLPLELNFASGYSGPTPANERPANRTYSSINVVLYAPLSRGRTHIISSSPTDPPALDPNYHAHPMDRAVHIAGMKLARRMLIAPPLNESFINEFEPGAEKVTDEEILAWMRTAIAPDQHETGTAAMLPKELGGVVDTKLKVYGTANVRVVDASIIPFPVSAHMSSTIYAIGEMAADIIRKQK